MVRVSISILGFILVSVFFVTAQEPETLKINQTVEKQIKGGETNKFLVKLTTNQTAKLKIEASGISFFINGHQPNGEKCLELGYDSGLSRNNTVLLIAKEAGDYRLEISPTDAKQKLTNYKLKLVEIRPTTPEDLKFNESSTEIVKLIVKADLIEPQQTETTNRTVLGYYNQVIKLAEITNDKFLQGKIYLRINFVHRRLAEYKLAVEANEKGAEIWRELGSKADQSIALNSMGVALNALNQYETAIKVLGEAIILAREAKSETAEAFALGTRAVSYADSGKPVEAIADNLKVVEIFKKLNRKTDFARSCVNVGRFYFLIGENEKAIEFYDQAIPIFKETNDRTALAVTYQNYSTVYSRKGELRKAAESNKNGAEIFLSIGDKNGLGSVNNNLGLIYYRLGEYEAAIEYLNKSITFHREVGGRREATALNNLAKTFNKLGENEKAIELLNEALILHRTNKNLSGEATALATFGDIYEEINDLPKARQYYEQALNLWRSSKDRNSEAGGLTFLGNLERKAKNYTKAIEFYTQSVELSRAVSNKLYEGNNLNNLGLVYEQQNEKTKALEHLQQARELYLQTEDNFNVAANLFYQARIRNNLNQLTEARQNIEASIEILEKLRSSIPTQNLRSSFFATVQEYYELYVEILSKMHEQDGTKRFDILAFEASEKGRSRSLIELLQEAKVNLREGADEKLLQREKEIIELLSQKSFERTRLINGKFTLEQKTKYDNEINVLNAELETIKINLRKQNPKYAAISKAVPLSAKELQNLLDNETVLLEYRLGENRSFLWLVTNKDIKIFNLPKREEVEKIGKEFYSAVTTKGKIDETSTKLSQILFGQISANIKNKRVALVGDGILQFIPFAALIENETIVLPSAGVLAELQQNIPKAANKTISIFADPVFDQNDARLGATAKNENPPKPKELSKVLRDFSFGENLPRLLSSRFEANNISAFVPKEKADIHIDFEASRENVLQQNLKDYQILHFATHGLLDSTRPEFSGLVFSLYDKDGKLQDGFLRLNQIYNLNLNSDLVVLSACQTALGKDVRGEGLIGLTRGFLYAGAKRIVASLWKVDDAATAEFMKKFYQNLLVKRLKPAKALRQTQNEMKLIPRFKSPYYWAGFTIQGDWK